VDGELKHRTLTEQIIGTFYDVYNELGHGFIESVYEKALEFALTQQGIRVQRQIDIAVWFRGKTIGEFSADMLVEDCVLLELKACRALDSAHEAQLLNYLRGTEIEVGLLLNFGLKPQVRRLVFDNVRKKVPKRSLVDNLFSRD
jgi:GxxExxY protein